MRHRKAVLSSLVLVALASSSAWVSGCSNDDQTDPTPPPGGFDATPGGGGDDSALYPPSECARVGDEVQVTADANVFTLTLLWDTDHYLLAYADRSVNGGEIFTKLLDAAGNPVSEPIAIGSPPNFSKIPSVTKVATGGYLLAWEEGAKPWAPGQGDREVGYAPAEVYTVALDANGAPTGAPLLIATSSAEEARPIVTTGPESPILTWMEGDYFSGASTAYVAKLDATGAVVGTKVALGTASSAFPHVKGDATGVAVIYSQGSGADSASIVFGMLDPKLAVTSPQSLRVPPGDARLARLSRSGSSFLAAWEDFRSTNEQVYMALVDPVANAKTPETLVENPGTGSANWPNIASKEDGSASAIVYYQFRQSRPQIFLAYIDSTGTKIGGDLQVSGTPITANAKYPDVQWTGSNFGTAWIDSRLGPAQVYFANVVCP
ncbi:MAG: hypothetical protein MUF34_03595 [Polyangiaceae bacterium]|nr:hypothetical protein [Polyangiaceae bacterium]